MQLIFDSFYYFLAKNWYYYPLFWQREYEEFKIRINGLVSKAQKVPEEGWIMQDGTPWPGNNTRDHPGMIQVIQLYQIM